jgi:hypothetical protein
MIKPYDTDLAVSALQSWIGRECTEISRRDFDWAFSFEDAGGVSSEGPWRIISDNRIALTNADHGQLFGLKEPVDGPAKAKELLSEKKVVSIMIAPISSDLAVSFDDETVLEVFNYSSGYEGWEAVARSNGGGSYVIAMGGGGLSIYKQERGSS